MLTGRRWFVSKTLQSFLEARQKHKNFSKRTRVRGMNSIKAANQLLSGIAITWGPVNHLFIVTAFLDWIPVVMGAGL